MRNIIAITALLSLVLITTPVWADNFGGATIVEPSQEDCVQYIPVLPIEGPRGLSGSRGGIGPQGPAGMDGADGADGEDGADGNGIESSIIDQEGNLILVRDDGEMMYPGSVRPDYRPWIWFLGALLVIAVICLLYYLLRSRNESNLNSCESARIKNGDLLILTAAAFDQPCTYEEEGRSGRHKFTIGVQPEKQRTDTSDFRDSLVRQLDARFSARLAESEARRQQPTVVLPPKTKDLIEDPAPMAKDPKPEPKAGHRDFTWDGLDSKNKPFASEDAANKAANRRGFKATEYKVAKDGEGFKVALNRAPKKK